MGRLPQPDDFPPKLVVTIVPPPKDDSPRNVLLLLHGLGDNVDSFAQLGRQMNLPETAGVAVQAPQGLLDLGGHHWGDDLIFDSSHGGLDADAGFRQSTALLKLLITDVLVLKCGFALREVMLFGFGQGGMVALNVAAAIFQAPLAKDPLITELGGVISIGAPLPAEAPASLDPKCRTPVLVCAGSADSAVTRSGEDKLRYVFQYVDVKRYRRPGDKMPANRDEMLPIMEFFSRRLRSGKGVPDGSIEIT